MLNRTERRHPKKSINVHQVLEDLNTISKIKKAIEDGWQFEQGDKVMLNLDEIKRHPNYEDRVPAYREFCEKNADRVFTVKYSGLKPSLVCLAEDESKPTWLFWTGDLKPAE